MNPQKPKSLKIKPASAQAIIILRHRLEADILSWMKKCGLAYADLVDFIFFDNIAKGRQVDTLFGHTPKTAQAALDSMRKRLGQAKFSALADAGWRVFNIVDTLIDRPKSRRRLSNWRLPLGDGAMDQQQVKIVQPDAAAPRSQNPEGGRPRVPGSLPKACAPSVTEPPGASILDTIDARMVENWERLSDEDKRRCVLFLGGMGASIEEILTTAEQKADAERIFGVPVREIFSKFNVPTKPA
jgi:hypothetical protein